MANPKADALKRIAQARKQALADCWEYHEALIKSSATDEPIKKSGLLDYLYDIELSEWEDVGYFVGFLRGLDEAERIINGQQ